MSGAPTVRALPPTAPVPCAEAERCAPPCESWAHSRIFRSIRAALPAARLQSPGTSFLTCLHHDTSHTFRHILSHGLPDRRVVASDSSACNPPFACCPDELYQIAHQRGEQRPLSVPRFAQDYAFSSPTSRTARIAASYSCVPCAWSRRASQWPPALFSDMKTPTPPSERPSATRPMLRYISRSREDETSDPLACSSLRFSRVAWMNMSAGNV